MTKGIRASLQELKRIINEVGQEAGGGGEGEGKLHKESWPFSKSELEHPEKLNSYDKLIVELSAKMVWGEEYVDEYFEGDFDVEFVVYRNGKPTGDWYYLDEEPTEEIPAGAREILPYVEVYYHPKTGEETDQWRDVWVDEKGNFVRFAD